MDIKAPVSTIMTSKLVTVSPTERLTEIKRIFEENSFHHIPVVEFKKVIGIVSKSDFRLFLRGHSSCDEDRFYNEARLRAYKVKNIMTTKMAKLEENDKIDVALDVLKINLFHALPVLNENEELVGLVTTHDIIKSLAEEPATLTGS